jgi:glutathione peroxidase
MSQRVNLELNTGGGKVGRATSEIYDHTATDIYGNEIDFAEYRGKVLLVVNTASRCGFTSQYAELEQLHEQYLDRGLVILAFPCNQFGQQEPGEGEEITKFCQSRYGVQFKLFAKVDVNGDMEHPLFTFLKQQAPGLLGTSSIKWNFTKFLVGRNGRVVDRYAPTVRPFEIVPDIERELITR